MSLEAGTQLGDYRILSQVGSGAYGEVYEAEHAITRRRDAIKVLTDGRLHTVEQQQRFLQEIQVQASLHHPNIAAVYNAFSTPHGLALVMELVPGEPLSAILARGRIPMSRGICLVLEMLSALSYAHAAGVVHRDIKPENIIITPQGTLKLTDFGLARSATSPRLTQSGVFAGSPCYMSPEQARGTRTADSRSDTYSAGVVLYEVVTGQMPFTGDSTIEVLLAHQYAEPRPPQQVDQAVGAALSQVILTAIEKEPDRRYQTAGAFYTALQRAVFSPPPPAAVPAAAIPNPWKNRAAVAVCAYVILVAGTVGSVIRYRKMTPPVAARQAVATQAAPTALIPGMPQTEAAPPQGAPEAALSPNQNPPAPPYRSPGRARKAVPPPPTGLSFTASVTDGPVPTAAADAPAAPKPAPSRPVVADPVAAPPPAVSAPVEPAVPQSASPVLPAATENATVPAPKRRSVVVRMFQKVLRPHPKPAGSEPSVTAESPAGKPPGN